MHQPDGRLSKHKQTYPNSGNKNLVAFVQVLEVVLVCINGPNVVALFLIGQEGKSLAWRAPSEKLKRSGGNEVKGWNGVKPWNVIALAHRCISHYRQETSKKLKSVLWLTNGIIIRSKNERRHAVIHKVIKVNVTFGPTHVGFLPSVKSQNVFV